LAEGAISEPVKTAFGYAILRVSKIEPGTTKPFEAVSAELKKEIAAQRGKSDVQKLHDAIEDQRSAGKSLAEAANAVGLNARTIDAIDATGRDKEGKKVEGLIAGPDLLKAAFASDIGVDNDTVNTPDGGYVWFEVAGIEPAHERKLDEIKPDVEAAWRNDETQRVLADKATAMVKELQGGGELAALASAASLQVQHSNEVKRSGAAGFTPAAIVLIFHVPAVGVGQAAAAGSSRMVFHVLDSIVQPFDPDKPDSKQIAEQLKTGLSEDLISEYVRRLQNDYGVSVNPGALQAATGGDSGY
jgi:peptidyl-prolyl cis-trans isomerase D